MCKHTSSVSSSVQEGSLSSFDQFHHASKVGETTDNPHIGVSDDSLITLQASIDEIMKKMHENVSFGVNQRIIFLGPSTSGKTTIIHKLAGFIFHVEKGSRGNCLDTDNPLFPFSHHESRTQSPNVWVDEQENIAYWDCPGYGDSGGPEKDIINAFAIDQLFHNTRIQNEPTIYAAAESTDKVKEPINIKVKVILVVEESALCDNLGKRFYKLLSKITHLFVSKEELKRGLSVIVTKQYRFNDTTIENLYNDKKSLYQKSQKSGKIINSDDLDVLDVLEFLSKNSNRVSCLPYPKELVGEEYQSEELDCINQAHFITNPTIKFNIGLKEKKLLDGFVEKLNQSFSRFIDQEIMKFFINQINEHSDLVTKLRDNLKRDFEKLQTLQSDDNSQKINFSPQLFSYVSTLKNFLEHLSFFKKIDSTISNNAEKKWSTTLKQLDGFTILPAGNLLNGVLDIQGYIVGITDIVRIIKDKKLKNEELITDVRVNSEYFLFDENFESDEDFKIHGMHLSVEAKSLKIVGNPKIDISGIPGELPDPPIHGGTKDRNGKNGRAGSNGGNGGNFVVMGLDTLCNMENLTINVSGGCGGNGQDGGNGFDGENGADAKTEYVDNRVQGGENNALILRKKYTNENWMDFVINWGVKLLFTANDQFIEVYRTEGALGTPGGEAGFGGVGGSPGSNGKCDPCTWRNLIKEKEPRVIRNSDLTNDNKGSDGSDGRPGRRGKNGRAYGGVYYAEYVVPGIRSIVELSSFRDGIFSLTAGPTIMGGAVGGNVVIQEIFYKTIYETVKKSTQEAAKKAGKRAARQAMKASGKVVVRAVVRQAGREAAQAAVKEISVIAIKETLKEASKNMLTAMGKNILLTMIVSPISARLSSKWIEDPRYILTDFEGLMKVIHVQLPHLREDFMKTLLNSCWDNEYCEDELLMNMVSKSIGPTQNQEERISYIKTIFPYLSENTIECHLNECPDRHKNFLLTGSPLRKKELEILIHYLGLCEHIYTDSNTRNFFPEQKIVSIEQKWLQIINNKIEIRRLYKLLSSLNRRREDILKQQSIYERDGGLIAREQVLYIPAKPQLHELEKRYKHCIQSINQFLKSIPKTKLIESDKLENILSAKNN